MAPKILEQKHKADESRLLKDKRKHIQNLRVYLRRIDSDWATSTWKWLGVLHQQFMEGLLQ